MKNIFVKLSIGLILGFSIFKSFPLAYCVPPEYSDLEATLSDSNCTEEDIVKIAEDCAKMPTGHSMWTRLAEDGELNGYIYNDLNTYVAFKGESCPIDGFSEKDVNNENSMIKILIYTSPSFDAERYHRILSLNGVITENELSPEWSSKTISHFEKSQLRDLHIKFENKKENKKIIFCFDFSVWLSEFENSSHFFSVNDAMNCYNNFLKDCGINEKFSINYRTYCKINKVIADSFGGPESVEYEGKKYDNIEKLMQDYNFKILKFGSNVGVMQFCGNDSLVNVGLYGPVQEIGDYAFSCCKNLKNMVLPKFVIKIGDGAFKHCESLESINIPRYVTEIGKNVFNGCKKLNHIEYKGKDYSSPEDFMKAFNSHVIESKKEKIKYRYFWGREDLRNIEIQGPVNKICDNAFERCTNLEHVKFPDSVEKVGDNVFLYCFNLKSIEYKGKVYHSPEEFEKAVNTKILEAEGDIAEYQFAGMTNLKDIKIPNSVENIKNGAFRKCANLRNVIISDGVKTIGHKCFMGCPSLKSINIPDSVTEIGSCAFACCENLDHIEYQGEVYNSVEEFLDEFTGRNIVLEMDRITVKQFCNRKDLKRVKVKEPVYSIGGMAFESCVFLEEVSLPNTLKLINGRAFKNCVSLNKINIPNSVDYICPSAFLKCPNLNKIEYDGKVYSSVEDFFKAFKGRTK